MIADAGITSSYGCIYGIDQCLYPKIPQFIGMLTVPLFYKTILGMIRGMCLDLMRVLSILAAKSDCLFLGEGGCQRHIYSEPVLGSLN